MKATDEAKIGMAVLAAILLLALAVCLVHPSTLFSRHYTLYASLTDAKGLRKDAEVLFAGVHAGKVTGVKLNGDRARVTLSMEPEVRIPKDATCSIGKLGLISAPYVAISGGHEEAGYFSPGGFIPETAPSDLTPLINKADRLLKTVETIEDNAGKFTK